MSAEQAILITVEECPHCGVKLKRQFEQGDYIGKLGHTCDFCGSRMYVKMIYRETPVEPARTRTRRGLRL